MDPENQGLVGEYHLPGTSLATGGSSHVSCVGPRLLQDMKKTSRRSWRPAVGKKLEPVAVGPNWGAEIIRFSMDVVEGCLQCVASLLAWVTFGCSDVLDVDQSRCTAYWRHGPPAMNQQPIRRTGLAEVSRFRSCSSTSNPVISSFRGQIQKLC